jgi:hypothetical protein
VTAASRPQSDADKILWMLVNVTGLKISISLPDGQPYVIAEGVSWVAHTESWRSISQQIDALFQEFWRNANGPDL